MATLLFNLCFNLYFFPSFSAFLIAKFTTPLHFLCTTLVLHCRGLQPILQAFESTGADDTATYFWPLLLHLLMLGELESAAHLLHLGAAQPRQQKQSQELAGPVASLVQLLEQRMQLPPFVEATGDDESATQQVETLVNATSLIYRIALVCFVFFLLYLRCCSFNFSFLTYIRLLH